MNTEQTKLYVFQKPPGTGSGQCPDALRLDGVLKRYDVKPDEVMLPDRMVPRNVRHELMDARVCGKGTPLYVVVGKGDDGKEFAIDHLECPPEGEEDALVEFLQRNGWMPVFTQ